MMAHQNTTCLVQHLSRQQADGQVIHHITLTFLDQVELTFSFIVLTFKNIVIVHFFNAAGFIVALLEMGVLFIYKLLFRKKFVIIIIYIGNVCFFNKYVLFNDHVPVVQWSEHCATNLSVRVQR